MTSVIRYLKPLLDYKEKFKSGYFKIFKNFFLEKGPIIKVDLPYYKFPIYLRRHTSDSWVFNQIFLLEEYKLPRRFESNKIEYVVDCGANIGLGALYFSYKYPAAKVVAIELERKNFEYLTKNTKAAANILPLNAGVWWENTSLEIAETDASNWEFSAKKIDGEGQTNSSIPGMTIDAILDKFNFPRIDLLKIDIEGAEYELFLHNPDSFLAKTRILVIELHDWIAPNTSKVFFEALSRYKYILVCRGENIYCELLGREDDASVN